MRFLRSFCNALPKSKIEEMAELMNSSKWEREILIDLLCEPKAKTIDSLDHTSRSNYTQRVTQIERRVANFLFDNPDFVDYHLLLNLYLQTYDKK